MCAWCLFWMTTAHETCRIFFYVLSGNVLWMSSSTLHLVSTFCKAECPYSTAGNENFRWSQGLEHCFQSFLSPARSHVYPPSPAVKVHIYLCSKGVVLFQSKMGTGATHAARSSLINGAALDREARRRDLRPNCGCSFSIVMISTSIICVQQARWIEIGEPQRG